MPGAVEVTSLLPFDCVYATCRSEAPKGSRNGSGFSQLAPPTFREKGLRRKSGDMSVVGILHRTHFATLRKEVGWLSIKNQGNYPPTDQMVKPTQSQLAPRRLSLHDLDKKINRRFALKQRNFKQSAISCSTLPESPSTALLTRTISLLHKEWTMEFQTESPWPAEHTDPAKCESLADKSAMEDSNLLDAPFTVVIPQGYWDDLFDNALTALNKVPYEDDVQSTTM